MSEYKKIVAQNKRARFEYFIEEVIEAGIVLKGSEVKSIRAGKVALADSHAAASDGELFLNNCHIAEYEKANRLNHVTHRPRKLLLHKREIQKIFGKIKLKGYTLIALSMYFNKKNIVKIELGLSKGKKQHDKRQSIKEKDWKREQGRIMRDKR
ncbi:SsrA-binding protein SmpB [Rickettsiaceae bacterium]|nr:SsrA-binding protein SmpB [Rickettsiaceae bacterium]